jgi:hypothetical protein
MPISSFPTFQIRSNLDFINSFPQQITPGFTQIEINIDLEKYFILEIYPEENFIEILVFNQRGRIFGIKFS